MNKSELRIGNFIEYEATTHVVEELHSDKVLHQWLQGAGSGYVTSYKSIKGIELTPEWLDRFGLTKHNQFYAKSWGKNGVEIVTYSEIYKSFMYQLSDHKDIVITSVHHLQNLFFALTGRELELKK